MSNRRWWLKYILAGAFAVFALIFAFHPLSARADFGDFAGDTDYGGGGDYDSGGWSSDSDDYDSSSGSGDFGAGDVIGTLIFIGIVIYYLVKGRENKSTKRKGGQPAGAAVTPDGMLMPMSEYASLDPNFNEAAFREHMSNLYVQMQQEWHNKDIEPLKPYFTDAYWNQMDRQLDQKRKAGQTPCTERIAVLETTPRGFYQSAGMDHIVVRMRARLVAYVLDDKTGKVISGDMNREKFMEYEWDVCRKSGVVTGAAGMQTVSCPHCGAPLNINQTAKCPYCDSIVTLVNEDWALNNIKGVSQQTR
ncbi:MAG: TIM44-like domain-containing protein [Lachnospiraceae bacterium]|nr:TIM44-like domain-containing protein [Lachnospiraceae bacterium]